MRKKLPIGIENFAEFSTENFYYVDKTRFIAELLRSWSKVNLFTRPRRFGKTLNMSMLKCFFEIGGDKTVFDGLQIMQQTALCEQYMGRFPVIFVSLKSVDGLSFAAAAAALRTVIGNEASRFYFLKHSDKLSDEEKLLYRQLTETGNARGGLYTMSDEAMTAGLKTLSQLLAKHYGSKIVILIDEYDVPLDKAFQAGYYDEMVSLMRNLLGNALKTNDSLQFAVLTGCLRISKESIFTGLNNLNVMTISDVRYDECFGFTDAEVGQLLQYYGLQSYHDTIRDWYDGYLFGGVKVYCPWDVINYCDVLLANPRARPQNYWANTSGNGIVRRLLQMAEQTTRDELEQLLAGQAVVKKVREELTYRDLDGTIDNLWSVLYSTGYLTRQNTDIAEDGLYELAIPNKEVQELFGDLVKEWFREVSRADVNRINKFCAAFPAGDTATIQEMLHDYLWDSISVRDTAVRRNMKENFYHGLLLGLLQSQGRWIVRSNAEAGLGYSDITVATPQRVGIVIELKYAEDGHLPAACARALEQIEQKQYAGELQRRGMKKILRYGIAFWEKDCMVAMADTGGPSGPVL